MPRLGQAGVIDRVNQNMDNCTGHSKIQITDRELLMKLMKHQWALGNGHEISK